MSKVSEMSLKEILDITDLIMRPTDIVHFCHDQDIIDEFMDRNRGKDLDFTEVKQFLLKYEDKIDKEKFRGAVEKTFKKREFDADLITNLNIVKESKVLKDKWISYSRKYSYARDVEFEETLKCLEQFINIIVPVLV